MPRIKLNLPHPSIPWTKVPNVVFDRLLPTLRDTELRLLLILIRQTSGWQREGKAITITYGRLKNRSGRQSEAVSFALKALEKRGLIHRDVARTEYRGDSPGTGGVGKRTQ